MYNITIYIRPGSVLVVSDRFKIRDTILITPVEKGNVKWTFQRYSDYTILPLETRFGNEIEIHYTDTLWNMIDPKSEANVQYVWVD